VADNSRVLLTTPTLDALMLDAGLLQLGSLAIFCSAAMKVNRKAR